MSNIKMLEIHCLIAMPPNNCNRGMAGEVKHTQFAGTERTRWASQAQKFQLRKAFGDSKRSKHLCEEISNLLQAKGVSSDIADILSTTAYNETGFTNEMILVEDSTIVKIADLIFSEQKSLMELHAANLAAAEAEKLAKAEAKAKLNKASKNGKETASKEPEEDAIIEETDDGAEVRNGKKISDIGEKIIKVLEVPTAGVSVFGRFVATERRCTVDSALAVSHAIGVFPMETDHDNWTCFDDVKKRVHNMGETGLSSPLMYQFAYMDIEKLENNLKKGGILDQRDKEIENFVRNFPRSIPQGMVNSTAHNVAPTCVVVVVRSGHTDHNHSGAFCNVRMKSGEDIESAAVRYLARHMQDAENAGHEMHTVSRISHVWNSNVEIPKYLEGNNIAEWERFIETAVKATK